MDISDKVKIFMRKSFQEKISVYWVRERWDFIYSSNRKVLSKL